MTAISIIAVRGTAPRKFRRTGSQLDIGHALTVKPCTDEAIDTVRRMVTNRFSDAPELLEMLGLKEEGLR